MSTALKVIQARVAQEDNAFSGVFNTSDLSHKMSSIPYVRVGGHIFKRWDKIKNDNVYVKILPNGLITMLTIDSDARDDDSIILSVCKMLAENGVPYKYFQDYEVSLASKKVQVMIPIEGDDADDDFGIDTRKADDEVSKGMALLSKLDAFIGTIPKSFELLGSTLTRQKNRNTDPDFMLTYLLSSKVDLTFEIEGSDRSSSKMNIPELTVHIEVNNGVNENDGTVKSFNDTLKSIKIDRLTNFDLIMTLIKATLKSEGVTSFAVTVFEYEIDHKSHNVSIQNKKAFEKELNALVAKYRFIVGK